MMPALKALFDLPRRLLPGQGARMQGYSDKRTIVGVKSIGAGGTFTLSRSEKSGILPSLNDTASPVELRAGQGVRLHGYGGIYTLERLLVPTEEEPPIPGPAKLEVQIQNRTGYAEVCLLYVADDPADGYVTHEVVTYNYEEGSYTETSSISGTIRAYNAGETPDECAAPTFETTYDPDLDTGVISTTVEKTIVSWVGVIDAAKGVVAYLNDQFPPGPFEWAHKDWQAESAITDRSSTLASSYISGILASVPSTIFTVSAPRYRFINTGTTVLAVTVVFTRLSDSFQQTVTTTVDHGQTSDWLDFPDLTAEDRWDAVIDRVRIGPYLSVP